MLDLPSLKGDIIAEPADWYKFYLNFRLLNILTDNSFKVLCSKCCNLKYRLEYLEAEARVCSKCYAILNMDTNSSSGSEVSHTNSPNRQPNPNNPMEYCSVVPPMQQVGSGVQNPPTVMVPVGVLKRKGDTLL